MFALLNAQPVRPGATLVLPTRHVESVYELRAPELLDVFALIRAIGPALRGVFGETGLTVRQNNGATSGQTEPHVHFHIVPRQDGDRE